jgi:hypothetical protein
MRLSDGSAIQDRLRRDRYTLIDTATNGHDAAALAAAFRSFGVPFEALSLPDPALRKVYERDLVLVRPDMHVAWRGDGLPADVADLASRVAGYGPVPRIPRHRG